MDRQYTQHLDGVPVKSWDRPLHIPHTDCISSSACTETRTTSLTQNALLYRTVLRIQLEMYPTFNWRDSAHGNSVKWHVWVEDSENEHVYHSEQWILTKKMMREEMQRLVFTIPIFEPLPTQYFVRCCQLLCDKQLANHRARSLIAG